MKKILQLIPVLLFFAFAGNRAYAQSIASYYIVQSYDVCGTYWVHASTSGCVAGGYAKIYWGDGTDSVSALYCDSFSTVGGVDSGYLYQFHPYSSSGTYTVKIVLYDGVPIDSVSFSADVRMCNFIWAIPYYDRNSNCALDMGEVLPYYYSPIEIDSAGVPVDTMGAGTTSLYRGYGPPGTVYALKLLATPPDLMLACSSSSVLYDTIAWAAPTPWAPKLFPFTCMPGATAFDLGLFSVFEPTLTRASAYSLVRNFSCESMPALLTFDYGPKYTLDSIVPAFSHTVSGTSVSIDVGTLSPFSYASVWVFLHATATLTIGDTVNTSFMVTPIAGDADTTNNIVVRCDTIRAAWDPNFKSVTPAGDIAAGTTLNYTLEFENTGNDTAHNIHILDTLSDNLDFSTFRGAASSHQMNITTYSEGGRNIVKFDFPNIMLPDSSHHNVCTGMVGFSIKAKSTLLPGAVITNRAGIYFDTNPVVMTNATYNDIPYPVIIDSSAIKARLYPNPVHDLLNIAFNSGSVSTVSICNVLGQQLHMEKVVNGNAVMVNVAMLPKGMYYAVLRGSGGVTTIKFDKL